MHGIGTVWSSRAEVVQLQRRHRVANLTPLNRICRFPMRGRSAGLLIDESTPACVFVVFAQV
jgi:hypothetical protein